MSQRYVCYMKKKIIIDTDPGQDDAVAIMLALASHELEVVGLTRRSGERSIRSNM